MTNNSGLHHSYEYVDLLIAPMCKRMAILYIAMLKPWLYIAWLSGWWSQFGLVVKGITLHVAVQSMTISMLMDSLLSHS